jgi:hypothetical protein
MPNPEYPDLNIPLLRKTVEWVEEQEELDTREAEDWVTESQVKWNQESWFHGTITGKEIEAVTLYNEVMKAYEVCDTTYCFAGKIVLDTGQWMPIILFSPGDENNLIGSEWGSGSIVNKETGRISDVMLEACRLLGLSEDPLVDGLNLFSGSNSASQIRSIAEIMAGEKL